MPVVGETPGIISPFPSVSLTDPGTRAATAAGVVDGAQTLPHGRGIVRFGSLGAE